jgi:hypothetical protein
MSQRRRSAEQRSAFRRALLKTSIEEKQQSLAFVEYE